MLATVEKGELQAPPGHKFQHHVDATFGVEAIVHGHDVGVPLVLLTFAIDCQFAANLVSGLLVTHVHLLERVQNRRHSVAR